LSSSRLDRGFTLIEALVAIVIGLAVVLGIGGLGERLIHHRTTGDSNSAAMSLAERQMEQLLAKQSPETDANLTSGTHTATSGSFNISWTVTDAATSGTAFVLSSGSNPAVANVKTITVTVTHAKNPLVRASISRHLEVNSNVNPP
jgi:prepilin-type N-terminal cleavage/methylation domain-containing protein